MKEGKHRAKLYGLRDRIEEACGRSGMTKAEIARKGNFNRKLLYSNNPSAIMIAKICMATGTSADWLLGLKKEESK